METHHFVAGKIHDISTGPFSIAILTSPGRVCLDDLLMKLPGTGDDLFATSSKLPDRHAIRSGGRPDWARLAFLETTRKGEFYMVLRDAKVLG